MDTYNPEKEAFMPKKTTENENSDINYDQEPASPRPTPNEIQIKADEIETTVDTSFQGLPDTGHQATVGFAYTIRDINRCARMRVGELTSTDEIRGFYPGYEQEDFQALSQRLQQKFEQMLATEDTNMRDRLLQISER